MFFEKKITVRKLFTLWIAAGLAMAASAQETPRFSGGLTAGISASQINGDDSDGYNKLGLVAGVRGEARLNERNALSIELLYAQRGSQSQFIRRDADDLSFDFSLRTDYIEVPVLWNYGLGAAIPGDDDTPGYQRWRIMAGASYARFIGSKVDEISSLSLVAPDFLKKNDVSAILGLSVQPNPYLSIQVRWVHSVLFMYNPRQWPNPPLPHGWQAHSLYFTLGLRL